MASPGPPRMARKTSFRDEAEVLAGDVSGLHEVRRRLQVATLEEDLDPGSPLIVRRRRPSMVAHALSGMIGSILAEMLLFPVDTTKLLVQTARADEARGFFGTLLQVVHEHGIGGLYKGVSTSLVKESVHSLNYWLWHGFLFGRYSAADDTSKTPTTARLLLNLLAKQLNWLCTVPFEVISSVNQLSANSPGFVATALALYEQGGVGAFYKGLTLSLVLAINPAIMNTLITNMLRAFALAKMAMGDDYEDARDHGPAAIGAATAISKIVATVTTYPLIRTKVLLQTGTQSSMLGIWREILRTEGWQGFYRGVLAMSYKTVLWNTLMMVFKHALGPRRAITPPSTPPMVAMRHPMPLMAREPFPADLITVEKLDEILSYLKGEGAAGKRHDRVHALESRMDGVSREVKEIKSLLKQLVDSHAEGGRGAPAAPARSPDPLARQLSHGSSQGGA